MTKTERQQRTRITDLDRVYVARTASSPPLGTWVSMIFSPRELPKKP